MASSTAAQAARTRGSLASELFPFALLIIGLLVRLGLAYFTFLNPDEALHYLLSVQPSAALAYKASLTTVHPPLFILWLYYWGLLGRSEFFLRLPCVLAGTAFCWIVFRWLESALSRTAGIIALALLLFLPPLMIISAELRQYAFLLFFLAASVFLFDRAWARTSTVEMFGSGLFLCLALLTHYSSFLFAGALAIYAAIRFASANVQRRLLPFWIVSQLVACSVMVFLWRSQISHLAVRGVLQGMAEGWFHQAVLQPGENVFWFVLKASLRFFHYLFWSGAVGAIGLLLFVAGITQLFRKREVSEIPSQPTPRQLAILLLLPFLINLAAAFAGKYPLGGTRHNAFLAMFAIAGISVPLARWSVHYRWSVAAGVAIALVIANFFPSPSGTYIRPKFQSRKLMHQATDFLAQSLPPGSSILADQESALLLSYYACPGAVVQIEPSPQPLHEFACGNKRVITTFPRWFIFDGNTLPGALNEIAEMQNSHTQGKLWFFQAGWLVEKEPDVGHVLTQHGCAAPRKFGGNILICELTAQNGAK